MPENESARGYGVDHVKVVEGLGCKAIRVYKQEEIDPAIQQAEKWIKEYQVPVMIEIILERVTNIAMGTEIDNVVEFEELAAGKADVPTAVAMLD
jgi:tartronate-semialdehyde synthase